MKLQPQNHHHMQLKIKKERAELMNPILNRKKKDDNYLMIYLNR